MASARALDVLVVSADPWWGRVASVVLTRAGHCPRVAADATGVLPRMGARAMPDAVLVLADGQDGTHTAERINLEAPTVPLVIAATDPGTWLASSVARVSRAPLVQAWAEPEVLVEAVELAARAYGPSLRVLEGRRNAV